MCIHDASIEGKCNWCYKEENRAIQRQLIEKERRAPKDRKGLYYHEGESWIK